MATQCIEAGVDVDFATVYRALAPLVAIAQAAGRCNRHGRRPVGDMVVFRPDDEERLYPTDAYQQAALVTDSLLRLGAGPEGMDLYDPSCSPPTIASCMIWPAHRSRGSPTGCDPAPRTSPRWHASTA